MKRLTGILVTLGLALPGCMSGELGTDDEHAGLVQVGKADVWWTPCELEAVLAWVSDPSVDADTLEENGVNRRAANHIEAFRDGEDGEAGTIDDEVIDTLQVLDDISWVGPVTFEQLVFAVQSRCDEGGEPVAGGGMSIEVIFSPQAHYSDSHLGKAIELIAAAEHSIDLAM